MSLSYQLIHAIRQRLEKGIPEEVRKKVALHICDTIGISLAAHRGAPIALKSISGVSLGVKGGTASVVGSNQKLPPAYAAFSNTALAHALDYDDINDVARIHPTPITLAAALAAANIEGSRNTDLVTAVAIGNELLCRLGYAIEPRGTGSDSNWFLSQLFGYLGAAVTAGLVLGLDDSKLVHALGLAYMQLAGGKEPGIGVGSQARSIYPAFASMGGVQAAFLAREGVTAPSSSMDGKAGLFKIYFGKNLSENQQSTLLDTKSWAFSETSIKLFPSCRYSHPYIKSALIIRTNLKSERIREIVIGVNSTADMLCIPLKERCQPKTLQDAKFSIPFMVAFALVHGYVGLNNLTENALRNSQVLELANRIKIEQTQPDTIGLPLGDLCVKSTNGKPYRNKERLHPEVEFKDAKNKFEQCCQFANITNPKQLWEIINGNLDYDILSRLPELDNKSETALF